MITLVSYDSLYSLAILFIWNRIIHLILVPKKEETGSEKSFTLKDIALICSAEPGLSSGFSPEDQPETGHWLMMSVRKLHGEGLLSGPLSPLPLPLAAELCPSSSGEPWKAWYQSEWEDPAVAQRFVARYQDTQEVTREKLSVSAPPVDLWWVSFQ